MERRFAAALAASVFLIVAGYATLWIHDGTPVAVLGFVAIILGCGLPIAAGQKP